MEEGGERINTEGETTRGKYKWYFSSGIKPEDVQKSAKMKREWKKISQAILEKSKNICRSSSHAEQQTKQTPGNN